MLSTIITALIAGLGGVFIQWLRERKAEQDRNRANAQAALLQSLSEARNVEKTVTQDAARAASGADADFTALR